MIKIKKRREKRSKSASFIVHDFSRPRKRKTRRKSRRRQWRQFPQQTNANSSSKITQKGSRRDPAFDSAQKSTIERAMQISPNNRHFFFRIAKKGPEHDPEAVDYMHIRQRKKAQSNNGHVVQTLMNERAIFSRWQIREKPSRVAQPTWERRCPTNAGKVGENAAVS